MANAISLKDAVEARNSIDKEQRKAIANLYENWADEIGKKADYFKSLTTPSSAVQETQMRELEKMLRTTADAVNKEVESTVKSGMNYSALAVVESNTKWLESLGFDASKVDIAFNHVPDQVVSNILSGNLYKGGWSLSKSIWRDTNDTLKDLHEVIAGGLAENKSIYEISKDIEGYVRPSAAKNWNLTMKDGKKIYPKQVDYNAQRLARTLSQHAYQQSVVATSKKNPFILGIRWRATGSRACPICLARNGKIYSKNDLPMDHPNGMCTMEPVVADDMADQLADWFNSPDGTYPEIDEFAGNFGYVPNNKVANTISDSYVGYLTDSVAKQFVEKFGITPNISSISVDENDFTELMSGAYAYVKPADGSLHINPNIFKDEKTFYETIGGKIRAYHPNATPESILAHEYGHSISLKVDEKKIIDNAVARYVEKYPKSAMDAFIPDYQYAAESISHYAVTTEHELFAEAFGDVYANGDKAQELSKWIVEEVRRSMK